MTIDVRSAPCRPGSGMQQDLLPPSVHHWLNRRDHVPEGRRGRCGESSLWGDARALKLALHRRRLADRKRDTSF